jgi:beta-lactam-binding protein with PASTA domain
MGENGRVRRSALTLPLMVAAALLTAATACKATGSTGAGPGGTATGRPGSPAAVALPAVAGKRLIDAERQLLAAGFHHLSVLDATGQGRVVVNPENWTVRSQDPAGGTTLDRSARVTLKVGRPSDSAGSGSTAAGVVPDVRCKDLQSAQDALQAAGFRELGSTDGTGQGRVQIIDRNWVVIGQSAAPGSRPGTGTRIVLTVVKFGEPTGNSGCRS